MRAQWSGGILESEKPVKPSIPHCSLLTNIASFFTERLFKTRIWN